MCYAVNVNETQSIITYMEPSMQSEYFINPLNVLREVAFANDEKS